MHKALTIARSEFILGGQKSGKPRRAELLAQQWLGLSTCPCPWKTYPLLGFNSVRRALWKKADGRVTRMSSSLRP